jgi:hypothetical protein
MRHFELSVWAILTTEECSFGAAAINMIVRRKCEGFNLVTAAVCHGFACFESACKPCFNYTALYSSHGCTLGISPPEPRTQMHLCTMQGEIFRADGEVVSSSFVFQSAAPYRLSCAGAKLCLQHICLFLGMLAVVYIRYWLTSGSVHP